MSFIFSFKDCYLVRAMYLVPLLLTLFWPSGWVWWLMLAVVSRVGLEVAEFIVFHGCDDSLLGWWFTAGPGEDDEVTMAGILLNSYAFGLISLLLIDRVTIDYFSDLTRLVIIALGYMLISIGLAGSRTISDVADPPRDIP